MLVLGDMVLKNDVLLLSGATRAVVPVAFQIVFVGIGKVGFIVRWLVVQCTGITLPSHVITHGFE